MKRKTSVLQNDFNQDSQKGSDFDSCYEKLSVILHKNFAFLCIL